MIFNKNFVRGKKSFFILSWKIDCSLDPITQQRILHRRIHSDPLFSFSKDSINLNRARVTSPPPTPTYDVLQRKTTRKCSKYFIFSIR